MKEALFVLCSIFPDWLDRDVKSLADYGVTVEWLLPVAAGHIKKVLTKVLFGNIFPIMLNLTQSTLLDAVARLLRPLVKIFLRNGIEYGTVAELLRKVYVQVASEQLTEQGKRPTISSISAISGLTRKEAKRLNELERPASHSTHQRYNRSIRVISGWLNDKRFQNSKKQPAQLPLEGGENAFAALVKTYSGDIPASAMLQVLESSGAVEREGDGVRLLQHSYIPANDCAEKVDILGTDVAELIGTIGHNLSAPEGSLQFQRKVSNCLLSEESLRQFKSLAAEKSQQLLEEFNRWLGDHEQDELAAERTHYVAVGIYYTEDATHQHLQGDTHE